MIEHHHTTLIFLCSQHQQLATANSRHKFINQMVAVAESAMDKQQNWLVLILSSIRLRCFQSAPFPPSPQPVPGLTGCILRCASVVKSSEPCTYLARF